MITKERLEKDEEVLQRLLELQYGTRTPIEEMEYTKLLHIYYVDNDDIRIYWKTY